MSNPIRTWSMPAEHPGGNAAKKSDATLTDVADDPRSIWQRFNWRAMLTRRQMAISLGVSVAIFGLILIYCLTVGPRGYRSPEVSLGTYQFESRREVIAPIAWARFDLHVALLTEVDGLARFRLATRRHRVQQDVEQLLRQAQGGDFEDPTLAELKRQLQEQINETLDMRAIAEVIVTNLQIERTDPGDSSPSDAGPQTTAAASPWREAEAMAAGP